MTTNVKTKEQLKNAIQNKSEEIVIDDEELAKNIIKFKKIKKLSKYTLGVLLASIGIGATGLALAPVTGGSSALIGGLSSGVLYCITLPSGIIISTEAIMAIGILGILGLTTLFALWENYDVHLETSGPIKIILILHKNKK